MSVWAENWKSVMAFLAVATQWRVAGGGMAGLFWLGLDYAAVQVVLDVRHRQRRTRRRLLDDIMVMERAALEAFDEGRE